MNVFLKRQKAKGKRQKIYKLSLFSILFSLCSYSQEQPKDSVKSIEEVLISGVRAKDKNPITFTNVSKAQIAPRNLGQDIPILLNYLPSVVTTTDAGAGIGYTYMRVRGSDGSRINVTLNGVPFNDSESQGTFFVNLPDFASSLENIQLQRGVGTSTSGAGAFGASLNLQTKAAQQNSYAEIANSIGSFGTRKHTLAFGTGLHNNFEMNARISKIKSDGFIDRASSDLFGYYFDANYITKNTIIKAIAFGGKEKTYQAWNGLEDEEKLKNDRTYNSAGQYTDEFGNIKFYDDETDNYWQNHFQLHWNEKITSKWQSNLALYYTLGKGYFEQYREDENFSDYVLPDFNGITSTDLVRKRWLDNAFYGTTFSLNYKNTTTDIIIGGAANKYEGKHFGEVVWTQFYIPTTNKYYNNFGNKNDVNFYSKASQQIGKITVFADLQYRMVFYEANSIKFNDVNDTFRFFNPKAGITYTFNKASSIYGYFGIANKEPRRDDYESGSVKPERLQDYELGYKFKNKKTSLNINAFYMRYKNQLVATGALNDVGSPIFENSGKSMRAGIEIEAALQLASKFVLQPNITLSTNKNNNFYFERNGVLTNLGNTNIAYSPNMVIGNALTYSPIKTLQISLLTKYVGEQYMGNIDAEKSILPDYTTSDLNINYEWKINKGIKSIVFSGLINNIFDRTYESNGYFYTYNDNWSGPGISTIEGVGFYPQAGINFLIGMNLKF
ncbi:TonB-dependent receptor [Flavobacterium sp.]|jgi:iron complex outermembrane receptor protein|uniref:TonB-dependent receptor n=1 Tax=Flavobacterium sp. TaxID=239 RepID=UPI0037C193F3